MSEADTFVPTLRICSCAGGLISESKLDKKAPAPGTPAQHLRLVTMGWTDGEMLVMVREGGSVEVWDVMVRASGGVFFFVHSFAFPPDFFSLSISVFLESFSIFFFFLVVYELIAGYFRLWQTNCIQAFVVPFAMLTLLTGTWHLRRILIARLMRPMIWFKSLHSKKRFEIFFTFGALRAAQAFCCQDIQNYKLSMHFALGWPVFPVGSSLSSKGELSKTLELVDEASRRSVNPDLVMACEVWANGVVALLSSGNIKAVSDIHDDVPRQEQPVRFARLMKTQHSLPFEANLALRTSHFCRVFTGEKSSWSSELYASLATRILDY